MEEYLLLRTILIVILVILRFRLYKDQMLNQHKLMHHIMIETNMFQFYSSSIRYENQSKKLLATSTYEEKKQGS